MSYYQKAKILIIHGGKNIYVKKEENLFLNDLYILNLKHNFWQYVSVFNGPLDRRAFHVSVIHDSKLIIWGGMNSKGFLNSEAVFLELKQKKVSKLEVARSKNVG